MIGQWWSQPFAPEGSAAAEGIVKQLGRPVLDPLTILVREAAQNSWDARRPGVVDFSINIRALGDHASEWQRHLLPAPAAGSGVGLAELLTPKSLILTISDRNTVGLGGPLRAGVRARENEHADFVQFLRNVGEPSDHKFGGGTYGFGKGIFYRLSRAGSVLVSTRTSTGSGDERRRLMGAALGQSWYENHRRFTGRHWWGTVAPDNVPDPFLGARADEISRELGLPAFDEDATGTDIIIIGADLGTETRDASSRPRTPQEASTFLASSILWHLWPKFIPNVDGDHMRFFYGSGERSIAVPSPTKLSEFEPFVEALKEVRAGNGHHYLRTRPPKDAGTFNMQRCVNEVDKPSRSLITAARPFSGPLRHVARMRTPELVVDYLEGPAHPNSKLAYGGVFKASADADEAFAASEPPTHDDWVSAGLKSEVRGVVMQVRSRIMKMIDEELRPATGAGSGNAGGLGELSTRLASLIPVAGIKAQPIGKGDRIGGDSVSGSRGRGGRARIVGQPGIQIHRGRPYLVAKVFIPGSEQLRKIEAGAAIVTLSGGIEDAAPLGAAVSRINQWQPATGGLAVHGAVLDVLPGPDCEWWVYAEHVPDAVVRFRIREVRENAE